MGVVVENPTRDPSDLPLSTSATELLDIDYPIVSAPMDRVAGGRLAAAFSKAGGLGLIGGGYGDQTWLARQFGLAEAARMGCDFITWSRANQPHLIDSHWRITRWR
jgi:nitronate monooxygenase